LRPHPEKEKLRKNSMHYVLDYLTIKSENAAKPHSQKAKSVEGYLKSQTDISKILDFGCGKLRYSDILSGVSENVTFLDSRIQITRIQTIKNERISVLDYVKRKYPSSDCIAFEDIDQIKDNFDLIVCTNVLSAIPCEETISNMFTHFKRLVSKSGKIIIINQHRSSYFKKFESGKKHLFGYIYSGSRGNSYYGIMTREIIRELAKKHHLEVKRDWIVNEITFSELQ
jgi:2-polyprenyl-3-methyl-5-hydroxy-6-metoxy-1,4-benzoquinol methylase